MGRQCRYCVDYAIGLIKELKEAERNAELGKIRESNDNIKSAHDMIDVMVRDECLTKAVVAPISEDLSEAFTETESKAKAMKLSSIIGALHYDLASDVARFCQRKRE